MFDYEVNIRKIHEVCNTIYTKDRLGQNGIIETVFPSLPFIKMQLKNHIRQFDRHKLSIHLQFYNYLQMQRGHKK